MKIRSIGVLLLGSFFFLVGIIATSIKLATTELVLIDDPEFWVPMLISLAVGLLGGIITCTSIEKN